MSRSALFRRPAVLALLALVVFIGVFDTSQGPAAPIAAEPPDLQAQQDTQEGATSFPLTAVTLQPGWNLVGWMGATAVADATASIVGPFRSLFTYDAVAQDFRSFSPEAPAFLNTLDDLAFGDGVWIFVEQETDWLQPAPWWARRVDLLAGFNLAMWTGPNNVLIADALAGLGSALVAAFTYDAAAQEFLSFGPDRPAFLNTAEVLNYGDGVWLEVTRAVTWEQPPLQRIGTQDVMFIRRIARLDESGAEVDITDQVLAVADADLGPPLALRFGLVFREARSLVGGAVAENGVALPSITMTFGVVTRSSTAPSAAADAFLGVTDRVFVAISSAHLEAANYNLDLNDFTDVDLSAIEGVAVGDALRLDFVFAQTLERQGPLAEDGLSELAIFARRWNAGDLQILAAADGAGQLAAAVFRGQSATVVAGSALARWQAKAAVVAAGTQAGAITNALEAVNGAPLLLPFPELPVADAETDSFLAAFGPFILANLGPLAIGEVPVDTPPPDDTPIPRAPPVPSPPAAPSGAPAQTPPPSEVAAEILGAGDLFEAFFFVARPTVTIEPTVIVPGFEGDADPSVIAAAGSEIKLHFSGLTPNSPVTIVLGTGAGQSPPLLLTANFRGEVWKTLPPLRPAVYFVLVTDSRYGTGGARFFQW